MFHAFGILVELLVQLVLPGDKVVEAGDQFVAFFGAPPWPPGFELFGRIPQFLLVLYNSCKSSMSAAYLASVSARSVCSRRKLL